MCGASTVALLSFSHFQKIHITRVFKILTIIPPAPSPPVRIAWFPPPGGPEHPNSSPGRAGAVAGRVLKFKFVKKYCLEDYIQQITVRLQLQTEIFNCFRQCNVKTCCLQCPTNQDGQSKAGMFYFY